ELLKKIPFFNDFNTDELNILFGIINFFKYKSEQIVFKEGSIGDSMFFLISGKLEIQKLDSNGNNKIFASLYSPCIFGEMAMIENSLRSATVITRSDVEIAAIYRKDFDKL